ncbi:hypothetical protein L0337_45840, partial [candidate division KSB1 bacterium]|nr:hypothetical protein [candidate division KSB1 bacterium]
MLHTVASFLSSQTLLIFGMQIIRFSSAIKLYSLRDKITVIARRFLPKQSLDFQRIASLKNAR